MTDTSKRTPDEWVTDFLTLTRDEQRLVAESLDEALARSLACVEEDHVARLARQEEHITALGQALDQAAPARLSAARRALVATGYFTEDEVSDDVAPRIRELFTRMRKSDPLDAAR